MCVWTYAWDHEAEEHWGPKAASESFCRAVFLLRMLDGVSRCVWCGFTAACYVQGSPIKEMTQK